MKNKEKNKWKRFLEDYYFLIIPILITILIYSISLKYGFRNFDEDTLIKGFYVKKSFGEYLERFYLTYSAGVTETYGFTFSSIKNIHFSILGMPLYYLICFLFKTNAFLFHIWSLFLHCFAVYFLILLTHELSKSKKIALFSGLIWSIHPTNVESIVWATNWACPLGAALYFYTLHKITLFINKDLTNQTPTIFILISTTLQIFLVEHTITLPLAIFLVIIYQTKSFLYALKTSFPSFVVIVVYWFMRLVVTTRATSSLGSENLIQIIERVIYLTPQSFLHQLKLALFPINLTIDQLDLLTLDKNYLGVYNIFCILIFILFIYLALISRKRLPFFSMGLLSYFVSTSPFLQIIPLYSVVAERYNYFGSAFLIFGIISVLYKLFANKNKLFICFLIIVSTSLGGRTLFRITEWKDSSTLFYSTINNSSSLLKKGIWTYNLAISQEDENKKMELLKLSSNLLNLYLESPPPNIKLNTLLKYELDTNSLLAKASLRIAQIQEILNEKKLQNKYLVKALRLSRPNTQIKGLIYKNLGTYYFQVGNFIKSINYYKKSYLTSPEPNTNYAIAVCHLKLNDIANYEKYLKKSVSIVSTNNASALKTYGQLLELKKDFEGAIKYYKIATVLENSPEPYVLLATLYLKLNQIEKAFKTIRNGLYGHSENSSLLYLHGSILLNKEKTDAGIKDLIKVINIDESPNDIKISACQILVNIFLKQKDLKNAVKYNELTLMIDPNNQEALKNKHVLMVR